MQDQTMPTLSEWWGSAKQQLALRSPSTVSSAWLGAPLLLTLLIVLWPSWIWMAGRFGDGSDDPLGIVAVLALLALLWKHKSRLTFPRFPSRVSDLSLPLVWLACAAALFVAYVLGFAVLPALLSALLAVLCVAFVALALLPRSVATSAVLCLAVLALPLLASLQFYAGYPLRIVTAELSSWIFLLGFDVSRSGTNLLVNGQLIVVDAPCSGVQMVWMAYFTACAVALYKSIGNKSFMLRLPFVGLMVMAANVIRNSILVSAEAAGAPFTTWQHSAVGLVVLAVVCGAVAKWIASGKIENPNTAVGRATVANRTVALHTLLVYSAFAVVLSICAAQYLHLSTVATTARAVQATSSNTANLGTEYPTHWQGKRLRPLALTEVEERFAEKFPGTIARLTTGDEMLIVRTVSAPTRMLHPAADCFKGLGYTVHSQRLERIIGEAAQQGNQVQSKKIWQCFVAQKGAERLRVCERIEDDDGNAYTDTSSWYWAAVMRQSAAPWKAITVASPL